MVRLAFSAVTVAAFAMALSGGAAAGDREGYGGDPASAIAQYIEAIPTASGERSTTAGADSKISLPSTLLHRIDRQGGRDAGALKRIVADPAYGATPRTAPALGVSKPSDASDATFGSGGGGFSSAWLIGGVTILTVLAVCLRLARRT